MKPIGKHVRTPKIFWKLLAALGFVIGAIIYAHSDSPKIWYLVAAILTGLIWWGAIVLVHGLEKPEEPKTETPHAASTSTSLAPNSTTHPLTLKNLFDTDFRDTLSLNGNLSVTSPVDGLVHQIPYRVFLDFRSLAKFLAIFIPFDPDAFNYCAAVASKFQLALYDAESTVDVMMNDPGETSQTHLKDLTFSGRIFVYHENHFSSKRTRFLRRIIFQAKGLRAIQGQRLSRIALEGEPRSASA